MTQVCTEDVLYFLLYEKDRLPRACPSMTGLAPQDSPPDDHSKAGTGAEYFWIGVPGYATTLQPLQSWTMARPCQVQVGILHPSRLQISWPRCQHLTEANIFLHSAHSGPSSLHYGLFKSSCDTDVFSHTTQAVAHHLPRMLPGQRHRHSSRSLLCSKHPEWFTGGAHNLFGDPLIFFSQMKELIDPVSHNLCSAQLLSFLEF